MNRVLVSLVWVSLCVGLHVQRNIPNLVIPQISADEENVSFVYIVLENDRFVVSFKEVADAVAVGRFQNTLNETGWGILDISTSKLYSDSNQATAAGLVLKNRNNHDK